MSIEIPADDFGAIRVFQLKGNLPAGADNTDENLAALFGTKGLDSTFVDIIKIDDLSAMSLSDYIFQGYDVTLPAHDLPAVNRIEGYAILILSRASGGRLTTLTPASGVRHVTTYIPETQIEVIEPLRSDSAAGKLEQGQSKAPKSDARIGGMVATVALLVMFLLVVLMIWIA